jgi:hypothetical protein
MVHASANLGRVHSADACAISDELVQPVANYTP